MVKLFNFLYIVSVFSTISSRLFGPRGVAQKRLGNQAKRTLVFPNAIKMKIWNKTPSDLLDAKWKVKNLEMEAPLSRVAESQKQPVEIVTHYTKSVLKNSPKILWISYKISHTTNRICIYGKLETNGLLEKPKFMYTVYVTGTNACDKPRSPPANAFVSENHANGYKSYWKFVTAECAIVSHGFTHTLNVYILNFHNLPPVSVDGVLQAWTEQRPDQNKPDFNLSNVNLPYVNRPDQKKPNDQPDKNQSNVYQPNVNEPNVNQPNANEPKVNEPNVKIPNVNHPNANEPIVNKPKVNNPNVNFPNVINLNVNKPNVNNPNVNNPNVNKPNVNHPNVNHPNVNNPNVNKPNVNHPNVNNPNMNHLNVNHPNVNHPNVNHPNVNKPMNNPNMNKPNVNNPNMNHPNVNNPNVNFPNVNHPNVNKSNVNNPNVNKPNVNNPNVNEINVNNPNVNFPNVNNPNVNQPHQSQPDVNKPNQSQPKVNKPNQSQAKVNNPNQSQPTVNRPDHKNPNEVQQGIMPVNAENKETELQPAGTNTDSVNKSLSHQGTTSVNQPDYNKQNTFVFIPPARQPFHGEMIQQRISSRLRKKVKPTMTGSVQPNGMKENRKLSGGINVKPMAVQGKKKMTSSVSFTPLLERQNFE